MEFLTNHEIILSARRNATGPVWDYVCGGSESETAMRRNRLALDSIALRPRVLCDVSNIDMSTTILGHKSRLPMFLAPVASLQIIHPEGAKAADDAAEEFGILNMLSGHTQPGYREIGANSPHPKIYQIYVRGDDDWIRGLLDGVREAGFAALTVTVDAAVYSNRERQMLHGWIPPTRRNSEGREYLAGLDWDIWDRMAKIWGGPMILKGVSTAADARMAVEHGAAAVYLSNHGGRQLDYDRATINVLPRIVDAVDGRAEIYVDGGFVRGTDIVKAIAMGATAVGIGKLQAWALGAGGKDAILDCLAILENEIQIAMGLLGASSVGELGPRHLAKASPVGPAHEMSAFPHLPDGQIV